MNNNHRHHYKLYIFVFILFHFILIIKSQTTQSLPTHIKLYHFKNNLNADFGIPLPLTSTPGIVNNQLINGLPEYCCGSESVYASTDPSLVIVHNETTFNQWWQYSIDGRNYELYAPVIAYQQNSHEFSLTFPHLHYFPDRGFNNITEFPQYTDDPETDLYCWSISLDLLYRVPPPYGNYLYLYSSEIWIFADNELICDNGGMGYDTNSGYICDLPLRDHTLQIFKCNRENYSYNDDIIIYGYGVSCDVDDICGTCGIEMCPDKCEDIPTSCILERKLVNGHCIERERERDCEDDDVCTLDLCEEGRGCIHQEIEGCYCSIDNCYSDDLCILKYCINDHNCTTEPVICIGNSTCLEPECKLGECICSDHDPVTLSSTTSDTITITETISSTISTTGTITTSEIITSTIDITTQSSISTISSTISPINKEYECNQFSCPSGYCCINLYKSYTCVSRYFENNCNKDNLLNQFY